VDSQLAAWIAGIGAVLAAFAGVRLVIRETRRKERVDAQRTVSALEQSLNACHNDSINWRQYVFTIRARCADAGLFTPEPPEPTYDDAGPGSLLPGLGNDGPRRRWLRRRRRSSEPTPDHSADTGATG